MNSDNSSMDLDPKLAKQLFAEGAILIIAGVPRGTKFGIDLCAYTIDQNFRGVKMIPPGVHFVWCASQGLYGDEAPRVGFVHYFKKGEILVREWNDETEELNKRQIDTDAANLECQRLRDNICNLDQFLAPYDYRFVAPWKHLTDTITELVVERCRPALGTIRTNIELQSCSDADRPRGPLKFAHLHSYIAESELLPDLKPVEGTAPRFTSLPPRVPKNATPTDVTRYNIDCVEAIDELLKKFTSPLDLMEEIQLSFIFYLVGLSVESLEHWRIILNLLANSESAVKKYKMLYVKYSEVLAHQLPHIPEELMEPSERNTLYKDVKTMLVNLYMNGLGKSAEHLTKKLLKSMQWKFEGLLDDDPEELPVVVETENECGS